MPKIIFQINFQQDAKNWVRIAKETKHPFGRKMSEITRDIPKELLRKMRKLSEKQAIKAAYEHLRKKSGDFLPNLKASKALLEFYFAHKGKDLFELIAKVTGKPIYTGKFYATFTLISSAPYDPAKDWFMIIARNTTPKQITNICHEILHLQFIHYYHDYCLKQGLNEKKFQGLKESLTFVLNEPAFRKLYLAPDWGYPNHWKLRKDLENIWRKEKNFKKFLDKAIAAVKKAKK